jgi:hypothetical protein
MNLMVCSFAEDVVAVPPPVKISALNKKKRNKL